MYCDARTDGELVEDAVTSWCGDIVGHFSLIRNELKKFVEPKFLPFWCSVLTLLMSVIFWQRVVQPRPKYSYCIFLKGLCWVSVCWILNKTHCVPCLGCFLVFILCPVVPSIFGIICCVILQIYTHYTQNNFNTI